MRQICLHTLILLGLLGCAAPHTWTHSEKQGSAALTADRAFCRQLATQEDWRFYDAGRYFYRAPYPSSRTQGYRYDPLYSRTVNRSELRRDLERFCLKSRGWQWQPLDRQPENDQIKSPASVR